MTLMFMRIETRYYLDSKKGIGLRAEESEGYAALTYKIQKTIFRLECDY